MSAVSALWSVEVCDVAATATAVVVLVVHLIRRAAVARGPRHRHVG